MPPNLSDGQQWATHSQAAQCIQQITAIFLVIVTTIITLLNTYGPEPYHTSILSGYGWVYELLEGHPGHIHCELGVSREVFLKLVSVLHSFGYGSSRYICRYWGSTCHLPLHVCHWPYYSTHWQVIPAIKQHYFQVLSSYAQNIFYGTVLHHIHKSSWHTHPTITKDP